VSIASGDPERTHSAMHFRLSASLATEAFLLRRRHAVSRTYPTIVPSVPIISGGIGSDSCAWQSKAIASIPAVITERIIIRDIVNLPPCGCLKSLSSSRSGERSSSDRCPDEQRMQDYEGGGLYCAVPSIEASHSARGKFCAWSSSISHPISYGTRRTLAIPSSKRR
jgi:hypothetical protein